MLVTIRLLGRNIGADSFCIEADSFNLGADSFCVGIELFGAAVGVFGVAAWSRWMGGSAAILEQPARRAKVGLTQSSHGVSDVAFEAIGIQLGVPKHDEGFGPQEIRQTKRKAETTTQSSDPKLRRRNFCFLRCGFDF